MGTQKVKYDMSVAMEEGRKKLDKRELAFQCCRATDLGSPTRQPSPSHFGPSQLLRSRSTQSGVSPTNYYVGARFGLTDVT